MYILVREQLQTLTFELVHFLIDLDAADLIFVIAVNYLHAHFLLIVTLSLIIGSILTGGTLQLVVETPI